METAIFVFTSIVLSGLCYWPVSWLVNESTSRVTRPEIITEDEWENLSSPPSEKSGAILGVLERLLSAMTFYTTGYFVLGGWLTLKLGSKWQTWSSIAKAPDKCGEFSDMEWFVARRILASWLSQRFLIGTLSNVLIGWLIYYVASFVANVVICYLETGRIVI